MKMSIVTSTGVPARLETELEHNGEILKWNVACFDKRSFANHDVCKHINSFWEKLPYFRQEKVFGIYKKIKNVFDAVFETTDLISHLVPIVTELCDEHPVDELSQWIAFHAGDIIIPDKFDEIYIASDEKPGNREKTYTKPDYRQLVSMTLALRIMIPVWGEFIYRTKSETGTNFKELFAGQLLMMSKLCHSPPMEKLRTYVESNIQNDKPMSSAIIGGISSEDYGQWLLNLVLVRRLCVGDISGLDPLTNLVTFIYNFIVQKLSGNNNASFGEMIKDKSFESGDSSSDHNASRLEGYKIKQEAPIGDMVIYDYYMEDPLKVVKLLMPDVDQRMFWEFYNSTQVLERENIASAQVILTQWILAPVLSPRGIVHLSKKKTISAIVVAQTVLWQKGHKELAALISAVASTNDNEMQLGGINPSARLNKEQIDELSKLYPYYKVMSTKQKTKPVNAAVAAIDSVVNMLSQRDWILTLPDQYAETLLGNQNTRRYTCPYDIKVMLGKLVIEIANRPSLKTPDDFAHLEPSNKF